MRCLIFDPYCGASERMILGALLSCGADEWRVKSAVEGLCGAPLRITEVKTGATTAKLAVISGKDAKVWPGYVSRDEAIERLNVMHESEPVRNDAMAVVNALFDAREGRGKADPVQISLGSMGMVGGICAAFDSLGRPRVFSTPAALGGGLVETACGPAPVPRPETAVLLAGSRLSTQGGPFDGELLTPEAAALLARFVKESGRYYPENRMLAAGYGQGDLDLPVPHVLRTVLCEVDDALIGDRIELLETNVDDVTGEVLGNLIEELLAMGARDVSIIPATMKKGRCGQLVRVVAKAEDGPALSRRIMLETGTLGVRVIPVKHRYIAKREIRMIKVNLEGTEYTLRFKLASDLNGKVLDISVEYEDAKKVARELSVPLKTVMRKAETEAWQTYDAGNVRQP